jgi:hypothetical protein
VLMEPPLGADLLGSHLYDRLEKRWGSSMDCTCGGHPTGESDPPPPRQMGRRLVGVGGRRVARGRGLGLSHRPTSSSVMGGGGAASAACTWRNGCCFRHCSSPECHQDRMLVSNDSESLAIRSAISAGRAPAFEPWCPILNLKHSCVPLQAADLPSYQRCREMSALPVTADHHACGPWDASVFEAAASGLAVLHFIGDSMAAQQWRSLLCTEIVRLSIVDIRRATCASKHTSHVEVCVVLRGVGTAKGLRVCHTRGTGIASVLAAASAARRQYAAAGEAAALVLSAHAHEPTVSEADHVNALLGWRWAEGEPGLEARGGRRGRVRLIWRTRGATHYGEHGYRSAADQHERCRPVTAAQRSALLDSLDAVAQAKLREAGVGLLDANPSTLDAHAAHPVRCDAKGACTWDCRHFCQPGPVRCWNVALATLLMGNLTMDLA